MAGKRPGYLNELWRTGGGAVADSVDAITGFPNMMLGLAGSQYRTPQTNLGPMVPQPWATGNQIVRSVAPLMMPGSQEFGASKIDRAAAPVLQSAVDTGVNGMLRRRDVIAPRVENRTAQRAVDLGRQDIENATTAGYQDFNRRQVTKGIAAAGAAAVAGPKMLNKMMPEKAVEAATSAAAKVSSGVRTINPGVVHDLWDKMMGGEQDTFYGFIPKELQSVIRAHKRALSSATAPNEIQAHQKAIDAAEKFKKHAMNPRLTSKYNRLAADPNAPFEDLDAMMDKYNMAINKVFDHSAAALDEMGLRDMKPVDIRNFRAVPGRIIRNKRNGLLFHTDKDIYLPTGYEETDLAPR